MNAPCEVPVEDNFRGLEGLTLGGSPLAQLEELERMYFNTGLSNVPEVQLAHWQHKPSKAWTAVKAGLARGAAAKSHRDVVDGQPLCFWESGNPSGPTVLLLHGFGSCKENWAFVTRLLGDQCHILAPDIFGFGDSHFRYDNDYTLTAQARRLIRWLHKRGHRKVTVVGNSMGGAIAAQMAALDTNCVGAICLMNAAGAPGNRLSELELSISQGENLLVPHDFGQTQRLFSTVMHQRQRVLGSAFSMLLSAEMTSRATLNHYLFGELVKSLRPTWQSLSAVNVPTLILWGDNDQILDPSCVDAFNSQLPQARALVLPKVGHLPMLEAPRATAKMLKWLALHGDKLVSTPTSTLQSA